MRELRKVSPFFLLMILTVFLVSLISIEVLLVNDSYGQDDLFVYPMEGQSDGQLEKDKYDCYQVLPVRRALLLSQPLPF